MSKKILGIGNAIDDVFVKVDDSFLLKNKLTKGSMKLIDKNKFERLKSIIKIEKIEAGGSVANTMAGISYLKGNPSFIGKINSDEFGKIYKKSLKKININFTYTERSENFLEGYLWDKGESELMFKHVISLAKKNNVKVAMSLSDIFCVARHRVDFLKLLLNDLNILIGNENEINKLMQKNNLLESINELKKVDKLIIITRSENGSLAISKNEIIQCKSNKVEKVLDLTGAGDLFASGFFKEYLDGSDIKKCLQQGSKLASKIIQKVGARLN